jgi:hypothetical protein
MVARTGANALAWKARELFRQSSGAPALPKVIGPAANVTARNAMGRSLVIRAPHAASLQTASSS